MPRSSIDLSDQSGLSTLAELVAAMGRASPGVGPLLVEMANYEEHRASAWLLGHDARQLLSDAADSGAMATDALLRLLEPEIEPNGSLRLVADMRSGEADVDLALLHSFEAGLRDSRLP